MFGHWPSSELAEVLPHWSHPVSQTGRWPVRTHVASNRRTSGFSSRADSFHILHFTCPLHCHTVWGPSSTICRWYPAVHGNFIWSFRSRSLEPRSGIPIPLILVSTNWSGSKSRKIWSHSLWHTCTKPHYIQISGLCCWCLYPSLNHPQTVHLDNNLTSTKDRHETRHLIIGEAADDKLFRRITTNPCHPFHRLPPCTNKCPPIRSATKNLPIPASGQRRQPSCMRLYD